MKFVDDSLRKEPTKFCKYVSTFQKNNSNLILLHVDGRPVGRPRRRWEGNIKMDLREM